MTVVCFVVTSSKLGLILTIAGNREFDFSNIISE